MKKDAKETVTTVTDYLNSFSDKGPDFIKEMSMEHRTLQQSFTKLCCQWLEHCASDEYRTDGRNELSKKVAKDMVEGFEKSVLGKPSEWLRMI